MNMLWQGATSKDFYFGDKLQGQGSDYGYLSVIYDFQRDVWTPDNRNAKFLVYGVLLNIMEATIMVHLISGWLILAIFV